MSDIQSLLGQFLGGPDNAAEHHAQGAHQGASFTDKIPGGLMGGAAAGGIVALLLGSKKARKFAGKAAGYGGAAVAGGLALRALQKWRSASADAQPQAHGIRKAQPQLSVVSTTPVKTFEISIITAMIAAAKADGHIDNVEQDRIFETVDRMEMSSDLKALVFDLLRQPLTVEDVARGVEGLEHKAEIYGASCLAIDEDDPRERAYLDQLERALNLPDGLAHQIRLG